MERRSGTLPSEATDRGGGGGSKRSADGLDEQDATQGGRDHPLDSGQDGGRRARSSSVRSGSGVRKKKRKYTKLTVESHGQSFGCVVSPSPKEKSGDIHPPRSDGESHPPPVAVTFAIEHPERCTICDCYIDEDNSCGCWMLCFETIDLDDNGCFFYRSL